LYRTLPPGNGLDRLELYARVRSFSLPLKFLWPWGNIIMVLDTGTDTGTKEWAGLRLLELGGQEDWR